MIPNEFISSLQNASKTGYTHLKPNGEALTYADRINRVVKKTITSRSSDLNEVIGKLIEDTNFQAFEKLSNTDQVAIIAKIRSVIKKVSPKNKESCQNKYNDFLGKIALNSDLSKALVIENLKTLQTKKIDSQASKVLMEEVISIFNSKHYPQFYKEIFPDFLRCLQKWDKSLDHTVSMSVWDQRAGLLDKLREVIALRLGNLDETQILSLKLTLARLPSENYQKISTLFLSKKDQVTVLAEELERQEDKAVEALLKLLKTRNYKVSKKDHHRMTKLVKHLSLPNASKIETIILELKPRRWFSSARIGQLKRLIKAKAFFEDQLDLQEDEIAIPWWYHSTRKNGIEGITTEKTLRVAHHRTFKGAWVANVRKDPGGIGFYFGDYTIGFTEEIERPNHYVASWPVLSNYDILGINIAGWTGDHVRARAVQENISLEKKNTCVVALFSAVKKVQKIALRTLLKEKKFSKEYTVVSGSQLDFMQSKIFSILGLVNRTNQWRYNMPRYELWAQYGRRN